MLDPNHPEDRLRILDMVERANDHANDFGRTGLSNMVLLNGGAVIAFGALGDVFKVSAGCAAITSLTFFALGLFSAAFGFLLGFLVNSHRADFLQNALTGMNGSELMKPINKHNTVRLFAVASAAASLVFFAGGSVASLIAIGSSP